MRTVLHEAQSKLGARFGQEGDWEVCSSFGDPEGEYRAVRTDAGIVDRTYRTLLAVEGPDAREFLHGYVTNDIKGLPEAKGCHAALLTVKGKMLADARVLNLGSRLLLDCEPGLGPRLMEHLDKYTIGSNVELKDVSDELGSIAVHGLHAQRVLGTFLGGDPGPVDELESLECSFDEQPLWVVGSRLTAEAGFDLIAPRPLLEPLYEALLEAGQGMRPIGTLAMEMLRVEAGEPRFGKDLDENTIPLEAGLERAISYTKGCYLGQEVIARVSHQGHVNRKLTGLLLAGEALPAAGTKLRAGEKEAGAITTAVRSPALGRPIALGYVRREHLEPGTRLETDSGTATVHPLPFYKPRG